MSLKSFFASDYLIFFRRSWPFFLIALLILLLLDSWQQTPAPTAAEAKQPLQSTHSARTVAGSYQQDAPPVYRTYSQKPQTWQGQGQNNAPVPLANDNIWQAAPPAMPRYRPLKPAESNTATVQSAPLAQPPYEYAKQHSIFREPAPAAATAPNNMLPPRQWSENPYRNSPISYPPTLQQPAPVYPTPPANSGQQYRYSSNDNPSSAGQWIPDFNQPQTSVGVQVAPNSAYYPPVWQSQPPGASYRSTQPTQDQQWRSQ